MKEFDLPDLVATLQGVVAKPFGIPRKIRNYPKKTRKSWEKFSKRVKRFCNFYDFVKFNWIKRFGKGIKSNF